jgi:hypothetical protein
VRSRIKPGEQAKQTAQRTSCVKEFGQDKMDKRNGSYSDGTTLQNMARDALQKP